VAARVLKAAVPGVVAGILALATAWAGWMHLGPARTLGIAAIVAAYACLELYVRLSDPSWADVFRRYRIWAVLVAAYCVCLVYSEAFRSLGTLPSVMHQMSIKGILALGMTVVIISGGIDLSVGAVLALAGCFAASAVKFHGASALSAILVALFFGLLAGSVSGGIIAKGRIQPFIVTLAMMTAARGFAHWLTGGQPVVIDYQAAPAAFMAIGSRTFVLPGTEKTEVALAAILFIVLAILVGLLLSRSTFGRHVYAIGGNEEAAALSGVNVSWRKVQVYTLAGLLSAVAALVAITRAGVANHGLGLTYELDAIAGAVIGGTALSGGVGMMSGTVAGVLLLGMLQKVLNLQGVPDYYQDILRGAIIVGAVLMARRR